MTDSARVLLDATDTRQRMIQHGAVFAAVALLLIARAAADVRPLWIAIGLIAAALALLVVAATAVQRWEVVHCGHRIRVENNPFRGEKLFVDGTLAARGRLGVISEMRATIASGDGAGDEIVVRTDARLTRFTCRIAVLPPPVSSDEQLLAEVRRRGLV